jgi:hypothetical protein
VEVSLPATILFTGKRNSIKAKDETEVTAIFYDCTGCSSAVLWIRIRI